MHFWSIPGLSKVGSVPLNGSVDGPFVHCGFKPRWILYKITATGNWHIWDTERDPYNLAGHLLWADTSGAEIVYNSTSYTIDIDANGFKFRSSNAYTNPSGGTGIYLAIADVAGGGNLPAILGN